MYIFTCIYCIYITMLNITYLTDISCQTKIFATTTAINFLIDCFEIFMLSNYGSLCKHSFYYR